jgi:phosphate starvation-inducible protein PhoH
MPPQGLEPIVSIATFLTALPEQWKAVSALVGSFTAGIAVAGTMLGAQVSENTTTIAITKDSVAVVANQVRDTNERLDELTRGQERTNCLIRLQLRGVSVDYVGTEEACP